MKTWQTLTFKLWETDVTTPLYLYDFPNCLYDWFVILYQMIPNPKAHKNLKPVSDRRYNLSISMKRDTIFAKTSFIDLVRIKNWWKNLLNCIYIERKNPYRFLMKNIHSNSFRSKNYWSNIWKADSNRIFCYPIDRMIGGSQSYPFNSCNCIQERYRYKCYYIAIIFIPINIKKKWNK